MLSPSMFNTLKIIGGKMHLDNLELKGVQKMSMQIDADDVGAVLKLEMLVDIQNMTPEEVENDS
jgi:hypothetical protein